MKTTATIPPYACKTLNTIVVGNRLYILLGILFIFFFGPLNAQENNEQPAEKKYIKIEIMRYPIQDKSRAIRESVTHRIEDEAETSEEFRSDEEETGIKMEEFSPVGTEMEALREKEMVKYQFKLASKTELPLSDPAEYSKKNARPEGTTNVLSCNPAKERCYMIDDHLGIHHNYCPTHKTMALKLDITEDGQYVYNDGHELVGDSELIEQYDGYKPITEVTFYYQAKENGLIIEGMSLKEFAALSPDKQKEMLNAVMKVMQTNNCFPPEYFNKGTSEKE